MGLLKYRKLTALFGASLIILTATTFITVVSGKGYYITPSPIISANVSNIYAGENITFTGQNFTPNSTAVLYYNIWNYSSNVDENGNVSWTFIVWQQDTNTIYALDNNSTDRISNTLTVNNSGPTPHIPYPTPGFPMDTTVIALIVTGAILTIREWSKKK